MNFKAPLVLICSTLLLFTGSCFADAAQLNWSGQWNNPDYQGQGIDISEYSDGIVIAHYYGYRDDGSQLWLIAVGEREGDTAVLDAWTTRDGFSGDIQGERQHTEIEWGTLEIREEDGALYMLAYPNDQVGWEYPLYPIYVPETDDEPAPAPTDEPDPAPTDEPDPAPDDDPEPASDEQPAAVIKIETPLYSETGIRWLEHSGQKLVSMTKLPFEVRITVVEGTLTITGTYTAGPHHPTLTGVRSGQVLQTGDTVKVRCDVDPDKREQQTGNYSTVDFGVYTAELGQILQLSANVAK